MNLGTPLKLLRQFLLSQRQTDRFRSRVNCSITANFVESYLKTARAGDPTRLLQYGRKVYSQNEEDGIIQEIFDRIGTASRRFVEIGAADGMENNTVWLLRQGWSGTWFEGRESLVAAIREKFQPLVAQGRLDVKREFVDQESARRLDKAGAFKDIDLFSLDIDGNDYHIVAALEHLDARLVVLEYNAKYPPPYKFAMKYNANPDFNWDLTDYSGVSLSAWDELMNGKGYSLVACNITGVNAFYVRKDLLAGKFCEPLTAENHYEPARYWLTSGFVSGHPPNYGPNHFGE